MKDCELQPLVESIHRLVHELREDREQRRSENHNHALLHRIAELEIKIMGTQTELAKELRDLKTQMEKVAKEQSDRSDALAKTITDLEAVIAAGGAVSQEVTDALASVKAAVQALDDTIPDAPPTEG